MKRLLIWLMLLCLPALAQAGEVLIPPETVLHTGGASPQAQALARTIYEAVLRGEEEIQLPENTAYDTANAAMETLHRDYPELCHFTGEWTVYYYRDEPGLATGVAPGYQGGMADVSALLSAAREAVQRTQGTQTERAEALHDWLCLQTAYTLNRPHTATAYGAILNGAAQCEGYAKALVLLYRMAGIPAGLVTGTARNGQGAEESHAWVLACIDGVYTQIDPTFNDGVSDRVVHWYYGLTQEQMAADHRPAQGSSLPPCADPSRNWHVRRGLVLEELSGLNAHLRALVRTGEAVELRCAEAALCGEIAASQGELLERYNAAAGEDAFYGECLLWYSAAQGCLLIDCLQDENNLP